MEIGITSVSAIFSTCIIDKPQDKMIYGSTAMCLYDGHDPFHSFCIDFVSLIKNVIKLVLGSVEPGSVGQAEQWLNLPCMIKFICCIISEGNI